jgi:hypothetical protein
MELRVRRANTLEWHWWMPEFPFKFFDPPLSELGLECQSLKPGLVTCGEAGSTGPHDH